MNYDDWHKIIMSKLNQLQDRVDALEETVNGKVTKVRDDKNG